MKRCKYPQCRKRSEKTWALVPLCDDHHEIIKKETADYYKSYSGFRYHHRVEYLKIAKIIPWSRVNMGEVMPSGKIRRD